MPRVATAHSCCCRVVATHSCTIVTAWLWQKLFFSPLLPSGLVPVALPYLCYWYQKMIMKVRWLTCHWDISSCQLWVVLGSQVLLLYFCCCLHIASELVGKWCFKILMKHYIFQISATPDVSIFFTFVYNAIKAVQRGCSLTKSLYKRNNAIWKRTTNHRRNKNKSN